MDCSLGFSYNSNPFSWLIRRKLGTTYSHVFLLFKLDNEDVVLHATRHGVNALGYTTFLSENTVIKIVPLQDRQRIRTAFHYCISKLGTAYSFLDIIALELGLHYEDGEKTLTCSEFVAHALGFNPGKLPDSITPKDLEEYQ